MPTAPETLVSQRAARRLRVEIDRTAANVRVTLSLPSGAERTNRKKVLERARRMLAVALEEEQRDTEKDSADKQANISPASGNGAWWLF